MLFFMNYFRVCFLWMIIGIFGCTPEVSRPNFIFLLTDDQRWDALGAAGNPIIQTPNMDKLASEGVLFTQAFVTTPICAVSRASILSGQYARRHGIWDFSTHFSDSAFSRTYPALLKNAGYRTGLIGKYGVGGVDDFPVEFFDYWKGFPGQGKYWHKDDAGGDIHLTSIMGDQAVAFIDSNPPETPFCLSVSFKAPHVQDNDPRQFLYDSLFSDLYKEVEIPMPATGDTSYWMRFPDFFRHNNEARRRWAVRFSTPEKYQTSVKGYYRLIYGVDVVIGRMRDALQIKDLAENTVIMLMGDNGFYLGEHGLAGKWYGHEQSIRVPFIIYDPRAQASVGGKRISEMVLNIDVAPTILDYAGLEKPQDMQGSSVIPLIEGSQNVWRTDFFFFYLFDHPRIPKSEGVITREWKYLIFPEEPEDNEWLFNLSIDPLESSNFVDSAGYGEVLKTYRERLNRLIEDAR